MLSSLIFIPIAGMLLVMLLPKDAKNMIRWVATGISVIPMVLSFWLTYDFFVNHAGSAAFQYVEGPFEWIPCCTRSTSSVSTASRFRCWP